MVLNLCRFEIWHPNYAGKAPKATDSNCRKNNTQCKILPPPSPQEHFGSIIATTELKIFIALKRKHLQTLLTHSIKNDISNSVFFRDVLIFKSKNDISGLYDATSNSSALLRTGSQVREDWVFILNNSFIGGINWYLTSRISSCGLLLHLLT